MFRSKPRPFRLLVADDDENIRELVELNFLMEGYEVFTAANGYHDQAVRSQRPDPLRLAPPGRVPGWPGRPAVTARR